MPPPCEGEDADSDERIEIIPSEVNTGNSIPTGSDGVFVCIVYILV